MWEEQYLEIKNSFWHLSFSRKFENASTEEKENISVQYGNNSKERHHSWIEKENDHKSTSRLWLTSGIIMPSDWYLNILLVYVFNFAIFQLKNV